MSSNKEYQWERLFTPQDMIDELEYINSQARIDLDERLNYSRKFSELSLEVNKIVEIKQKHYDELSSKLIARSNHYYLIKTWWLDPSEWIKKNYECNK